MSNHSQTHTNASGLPEASFEIRRSVSAPLLGLFVCVVFLAAWMLERFVGIGAAFLLSWGFTAFVFLFARPLGVLMAYVLMSREPVIAVRGFSLCVANVTLPWRKSVLAFEDILGIETDWIPGTSHARIVFHVTPERFAEETRSGPWIKRKDGKLFLDVLNTDSTPNTAAANLRLALADYCQG